MASGVPVLRRMDPERGIIDQVWELREREGAVVKATGIREYPCIATWQTGTSASNSFASQVSLVFYLKNTQRNRLHRFC